MQRIDRYCQQGNEEAFIKRYCTAILQKCLAFGSLDHGAVREFCPLIFYILHGSVFLYYGLHGNRSHSAFTHLQQPRPSSWYYLCLYGRASSCLCLITSWLLMGGREAPHYSAIPLHYIPLLPKDGRKASRERPGRVEIIHPSKTVSLLADMCLQCLLYPWGTVVALPQL